MMGGLAEAGLWQAVGKMGLASAGMAAALLIILPFLPLGPSWLGGLIGIAMGGVVYLGLAFVMGSEELAAVRRQVLRRR
jgi:hypothetical protein